MRLYFVEPQHTSAGARVFDVALQGKPVLTNFDIFVAAQGKMQCLVKEFTDVQLDGDCTLILCRAPGPEPAQRDRTRIDGSAARPAAGKWGDYTQVARWL